MSKHHLIYLAITIIYLMLASCTKHQAEEIKPETPVLPDKPDTPAVTYSNFVQALLQTKCSGCHAPGNSAASIFTLNGHASVTGSAGRIRQAVLVEKTMPKGGSLNATELAALAKWFDNGMPEN